MSAGVPSDAPEFTAPWYSGKSYQQLVVDGARRVHAGEYAIDDLSVHPERINKPEEEQEACIQQLQRDVQAFLEVYTPETDTSPADDTSTSGQARTADAIPWARVFNEFNFQYGNTGVSRTQLRGALAVSDHTSFGPNADDAESGTPETLDAVITDALEQGLLMEVSHRVGFVDLVADLDTSDGGER